jgi:tRNA pseudouridine55 synthase
VKQFVPVKNGFILIHKPEGPTSFDIIRNLRRQLNIKKMGHAGTLDPLASGLLVVAVGQATKLLPLVPVDTKEYHFAIQFGETRETGDREGEVAESGFPTPTIEELENILSQFRGTISQIPPKYSAIKINGRKAYELARKGEEVEIQPREVDISSLELIDFDDTTGLANLVVNCSSGTYVRSLAQDIATALNSGAYAARIHRTRVGMFYLTDAVTVEEVLTEESITPPEQLLTQWETISISGKKEKLFRNGNGVDIDHAEVESIWVTGEDSSLIALAKVDEGKIISLRNFTH